MRLDKTSNMLFLNDLNLSEIFQKVYQNSLFNNNDISSLLSITPFLIYA